MNKKGKILTGIIVGCLGATMLTSCSLSAEQNTNIDSMLNKGNALIDSIDDRLNETTLSINKAVSLLDEVRFNLKYHVNGFEKFEVNSTVMDESSGANSSYQCTLVADYSTNMKKHYMEQQRSNDSEIYNIAAYNYNSYFEVKSGYNYNKYTYKTTSSPNELQIQESLHETDMEYGYSIFNLLPNITAENITDFTKEDDTYVIKVKMTSITDADPYYRTTYYITYKIKDYKLTEFSLVNLTEISESILDEKDEFGNAYLENPTIMQLAQLTSTFKYGEDINLEFLNNGLKAIDDRIESGDLEYGTSHN